MTLYIDGHEYHYELECLCRMFFSYRKIEVIKGQRPSENDEEYIYTKMIRTDEKSSLYAKVKLDKSDKAVSESAEVDNNTENLDNFCEKELSRMLYRMLSKLTGIRLRWGILTGIRPVRLVHKFKDSGMTDVEIETFFRDSYYVSDDKISLALKTADIEKSIIELSSENSFSLYISIPFCPSRCNYCSFVSHSTEKTAKMIPEYVDKLCEELKYTAKIVKEQGLRLETVYFGGGTPTTLTAEQLTKLFKTVENEFDLSNVREYTVEAGRPDTITKDKLKAIQDAGVTRISINPQTLNDAVLREIGRRHTAEDTVDKYRLACDMGFDNINMDLIAGLPTDTYESFKATVDRVMELNPQNVTLHTLSVKRAARLASLAEKVYGEQHETVALMLEYAYKRFEEHGYRPYYLYRQKNTMGNMENVGFCKPGKEGLYNVYIMDETHSIIAAGAGGVTKLRSQNDGYIERIFNYKYPYEYLGRFEDILTRKGQVTEFYERYKNNQNNRS